MQNINHLVQKATQELLQCEQCPIKWIPWHDALAWSIEIIFKNPLPPPCPKKPIVIQLVQVQLRAFQLQIRVGL